jgi:hypothetical protein
VRQPWTVEPRTHEAGAWLNYPTGDLAAYRALAAAADAASGEATSTVEDDGRSYDVQIWLKGSGLEAPAPDDPDTPTLEAGRADDGAVREVVVTLAPTDGLPGETRTLTMSPRWPGMGTAFDPEYVGVSIRAQGANEPLDAYESLIRATLEAFDAPTDGFDAPALAEPASTLLGAARYVRVHRRHREAFMAQTGVVARLAEHVPGAERQTSGGRREVLLPAEGLAALFGEAGADPPAYAVALKAYMVRDPPDDPADPLAHPKVEARLHGERVPWADREAVRDALDQVLVNVLAWAGLPPRPGDGEAYVADRYFQAGEAAGTPDLIDSPLDALGREGDAVAQRAVAGLDRGECDRDVLRAVADGGRLHVSQAAAEAECSTRTVYRVADRHEALKVADGVVRYVSRGVRAAVGRLFDALARGAERLLGREGEDADPNPSDSDGSSLAGLRAAYSVEIDDPAEDPDADWLNAHVRNPPADAKLDSFFVALREAWCQNRDPGRLRWLRVVLHRRDGRDARRPFVCR